MTSRLYHVLFEKMGSRSKQILELAMSKNSVNEPSIDKIQYNQSSEHTIQPCEAQNDLAMNVLKEINKESNTMETNDNVTPGSSSFISRKRTVSSRSTSSSSSSTSSSSSSSTSSSSGEDSDDSIKDPNYEIIKEKRKRRFSPTEFRDFLASQINTLDSNHQIDVSSSMESDAIIIESSVELMQNNILISQSENTEPEPEFVIGRVEDIKEAETDPNITSPTKKGKKRCRQENKWKKNVARELRNNGKEYQSLKTKKINPQRTLKPPCNEKCTFKCPSNITEEQRLQLLKDYWDLGHIEKQWAFIANSVEKVKPKTRYVRVDDEGIPAPKRENNNAYFFIISGIKIRVCKTFYKNTLSINNRPIETALKKINQSTNISSMKDFRGSHGKHHRVEEAIKRGVKDFIESIPKIESHYLRNQSKRHYIDGSKTITDLHRDYVEQCKARNVSFANYVMFYRIFTQEYNISFFIPKKDMCEFCESYNNKTDAEKEIQKEMYQAHQNEKKLSRMEKAKDKSDVNLFVAVFDLQAVFQCPKGNTSVFYYKSKLNVLNLTIYDLKSNKVECYVWDETQAKRGVNEIGTCVYDYLHKISNDSEQEIDVVFYSDNCSGQQKNKFMFTMYHYAVQNLPNIRSVTHKFLIKGHTQNEGDSAHSQIEREVTRQLRSGSIYTPEGFIGAIKAARKKSEPMHVKELCFSDIYDWKLICNQMSLSFQKDEDNNTIKLAEIKVIKFEKQYPQGVYFKISYADEQFKRAIINKKNKDITNIALNKAYTRKPGLAENKKKDLMDLVAHNHIPGFYKTFFESL